MEKAPIRIDPSCKASAIKDGKKLSYFTSRIIRSEGITETAAGEGCKKSVLDKPL